MGAGATYLDARQQPVDPRFSSVDCLFFVIGAQKAGTTWLNRYFLDRDDISVPYWKEHNFWNMVEGQKDPGRMLLAQKARRETDGLLRKAATGLWFTKHAKRQKAITLALKASEAPVPPYSAYADALLENQTERTKAAGEICPQYALLTADTFAEMARLSGNVRFLFLMRDPVSRMISGAQHHLRKMDGGAEITADDLNTTVRNFTNELDNAMIERSRYDKTIEKLESVVAPDQIKYVFFEKLFDQEQVKEICEFLGVPFLPGETERKRNVAGKSAVGVGAEERAMMARALKPVYDFAKNRFGSDVPRKWQESAALC